MAEIATGNPYDAGQVGSGVGAVMFTPNHRDITDIGADWNRQNAADEAAAVEAQKQKLANARTLVGDLNFDTKGILDSDADYFRKEIGSIVNDYGELYKKYQGNPTSPEALLEKQKIDARKPMLEVLAHQSGAHKEELKNSLSRAEAHPELWDLDKGNNLTSQARMLSIPERQKLIDANGGSLAVALPLNPSTEIARILKDIKPDKTYTISKYDPISGRNINESTTGYSDEQMELVGKQSYVGDTRAQKSFDQAFGKLQNTNPILAKYYESEADRISAIALQNGKPRDAVVPAQVMAMDEAKKHAYQQLAAKAMPESEDQKWAAWKRRHDYRVAHPVPEKDTYEYQQMLNATAGDENAWSQAIPDQLTGKTILSGSALDGKSLGEIDIPVFQLKLQDVNGKKKMVPVATDNFKKGENFIIDSKATAETGADGTAQVGDRKYVDAATVIKAGYDPARVTQDDLAEHPDWYKPLTVQVVDQATHGSKLKVDREKFYQSKGAYDNNTPQIQKVVNADTRGVIPTGTTNPTLESATKINIPSKSDAVVDDMIANFKAAKVTPKIDFLDAYLKDGLKPDVAQKEKILREFTNPTERKEADALLNKSTPKTVVAEPKSKQEYDALPAGSKYIKNGVVKIKS